MPGSLIVDIFLILLLLAYLAYGFRHGLVRSLSGIIGVAVGGFLAVLIVPLVATWVPDPGLRTIATLAVVVGLVVGGHSVGAAIGRALHKRVKRGGLHIVDRLLGGILTAIVAALVASMLGASIGALGVPVLSQSIASSGVLRTIDDLTPDPVQGFLAQVRSATVDESLPRIAQALGAHTDSQDIPEVNTQTAALRTAARSVVKITGNAYSCGQSQSGSGFVVARNRVVTNAHVVAGVSQPIIEVRGEGALPGTVVYFDPKGDLALIAVKGLSLPTLKLTKTLAAGSKAVSDGYPYGGPFVSLPVGVSQVGTVNVDDIYGGGSAPREVYSLAANVQEGDSGGPLLSTSGRVAGVVFAKGATTDNVGYAITMRGLDPVAARAASLTERVSSGRCTKD